MYEKFVFTRRVVVFGLMLCFLFGTASAVRAQDVQCTISGSYWIIVDTNGTEGPQEPPSGTPEELRSALGGGEEDIGYDPAKFGYDSYFSMVDNNTGAGHELQVIGHGIFPSVTWPPDVSRYGIEQEKDNVTLVHDDPEHPSSKFTVTASKINGSPDLNHLEFTWSTRGDNINSAQATLKDTDKDGLYDYAEGFVDQITTPDVSFDSPIEFYTDNKTGKHYWHIPKKIEIGGLLPIDGLLYRIVSPSQGIWFGERSGPYDVYIPVGPSSLEVVCGDTTWGRVTLQTGVMQEIQIPLLFGWNLISLPYSPSDRAIEKVLASIAGSYSAVWAYQNKQWLVSDIKAGLSADNTTLSEMDAGWGYWIKMTGDKDLKIEGTVPDKTIQLLQGWNLVGYNHSQILPIETAVKSIEEQLEIVWAYQNGKWLMYDPNQPLFNDLREMAPGFGYWIKTKSDKAWTPEPQP